MIVQMKEYIDPTTGVVTLPDVTLTVMVGSGNEEHKKKPELVIKSLTLHRDGRGC